MTTPKDPTRSKAVGKGNSTRRGNRLAADVARAEAAGFHARGSQEWVPVASLFSDPRYQRDVDRRFVERMVANFDPDALGVIYVSDRGNGTYAVMDGFHRVELMRALGWDDQKMPAFVFSGISLEEEAEIFTKMNKDRRRPHPIDIFHSEVAAGRNDALGLHEVFVSAGVRVSKGGGGGILRAIASARRIYSIAGADVLRRSLKIMKQAFSRHDDTFNGDVLSGLALLIFTEPDLIDDKHLTERIGDFTPPMLVNKAGVAKEVIDGMTPAGAMAHVLTSVYNTRRRSGRLAPFSYLGWPKVTDRGVLYGNGWSETVPADADDETGKEEV